MKERHQRSTHRSTRIYPEYHPGISAQPMILSRLGPSSSRPRSREEWGLQVVLAGGSEGSFLCSLSSRFSGRGGGVGSLPRAWRGRGGVPWKWWCCRWRPHNRRLRSRRPRPASGRAVEVPSTVVAHGHRSFLAAADNSRFTLPRLIPEAEDRHTRCAASADPGERDRYALRRYAPAATFWKASCTAHRI